MPKVARANDVARDWTAAFGGTAPRVSGLGVGADGDNTASTVEAWFADLAFVAAR